MGIREDLLAFSTRLDSAIASVMKNEVFRAAQVDVMVSIEENVYAKYEPDAYIRRRDNGGLQDPSNIILKDENVVVATTPSESVFEMEVVDVAKDDWGFPVDKVIQSGKGYTWENSRIYKMEADGRPLRRPFYEAAEKMLVSDMAGSAEYWLREGLRNRGFTVV